MPGGGLLATLGRPDWARPNRPADKDGRKRAKPSASSDAASKNGRSVMLLLLLCGAMALLLACGFLKFHIPEEWASFSLFAKGVLTRLGFNQPGPLSDCFPPEENVCPAVSPRMVGGSDAPERRFPYMVTLRTHKDEHFCGGILIHPSMVLTAAHCVDEYSGVARRNRSAHIGAHGIDDNEDHGVKTVRIDKTTIHPNYTAGHWESGYDIALLRLKEAVMGIDIPGLADPHLILHCEMMLFTLGWGYPNSSFWSLSDKLQMSTHGQVLGSRARCAINEDLQLCMKAQKPHHENTCEGDSGGPALIPDMPGRDFVIGSPRKDLIVAVTSYGPDCSHPNSIGIYTRLSAMRNWIDGIMEVDFGQSSADTSSTMPDRIPGPGSRQGACLFCWVSFRWHQSVVQGMMIFLNLTWEKVKDSKTNQETLFKVFTKETASRAGIGEDRIVIMAIKSVEGKVGLEYKVVFPKPIWPLENSPTGSRDADRFLVASSRKHFGDGYLKEYDLDENSRMRMQWFQDVDAKDAFGNLPVHRSNPDSQVWSSFSPWRAFVFVGVLLAVARVGYFCAMALPTWWPVLKSPICLMERRPELESVALPKKLMSAVQSDDLDAAGNFCALFKLDDFRDKQGGTPLHYARSRAMVENLIQAGTNVDAEDQRKWTPLHHACSRSKGGQDVVAALLKAGASIEAQTFEGYTALHIAAYYGNVDVACELLNKKADVNAVNRIGYTPLHEAAQGGHAAVIHLLLMTRAKMIFAKGGLHHTGGKPIDVAMEFNHHEVVKILDATETLFAHQN